jgi:hypothetical protein
MDTNTLTQERKAPDPRGGDARTMLRYGLWLRLATAGGFLAVGAGAALVEGASAPVDALAWAAAGAALAVFAWRRAMAALAAVAAPASGTDAAPVVPDRAHRVPIGRSADAIRSRGALAARQG